MKRKIKEIVYRKFNISFSKSGEDIQIKKLINNRTPGVYVDIGCWDPIKASNTYYFSLRGWKGICIDPNPEISSYFKKIRPNDIFINNGISNQSGKRLKYYMFDKRHTSMNTFNDSFIEHYKLKKFIKKEIEVPTLSLEVLLDKFIKKNDRLDFFDVDVEGMDLEVLKSNNWEKYRPKIILVETNLSISRNLNSNLSLYMNSIEYSLCGKILTNRNLGNLIFIDNLQK